MSSPAREPFTHRLKSWPASFSAVLSGRKRFEFRKDDRTPQFQPGDIVDLREFDPFDQDGDAPSMQARGYTGRRAIYFVGYVDRSACLPDGWCGFDLVSPEDLNRVGLAVAHVNGAGR